MQQNNNNSLIGKQPLENGRKRQYETLMKLLSSTLPVRNKCLCGVSRSSSVVSNRSASSPVSPISPQSYRSQSSMSTMAGESHTSSPEMTWVRQAMVKYWYNWLGCSVWYWYPLCGEFGWGFWQRECWFKIQLIVKYPHHSWLSLSVLITNSMCQR